MNAVRITKHNGRAGKKGTFNPRHNDRSFDLKNAEHINPEMTKFNIYWNCYDGFYTPQDVREDGDLPDSFFDIERRYYAEHYQGYCDGQHERNRQAGHSKRDRTTDMLHADKRTAPEESYIQLGNKDLHQPQEVLLPFVKELFAELEERFGDHVHIIDWALHVDEATPHVHMRQVFDCENQYGELAPQQNKALKLMGFERPDPNQKEGRKNNPKMTFDALQREIMFEIADRHGIEIIRKPVVGGHKHMEKNDYIQMKQQERIDEQMATIKTQINEISENRETLGELKTRIEDTEKMIEEVTDAAYEKAVDAVAVAVQQETHKADLEEIEEYKKWLRSSDRKASKETRDYAVRQMDSLGNRIKNAFQKVKNRILSIFRKPEKKEEVMKPVRRSILADLEEKKQIVKEREATRGLQLPRKNRGMEI